MAPAEATLKNREVFDAFKKAHAEALRISTCDEEPLLVIRDVPQSPEERLTPERSSNFGTTSKTSRRDIACPPEWQSQSSGRVMRFEVNVGVRVYERLSDSLSYISNSLGSPQAAKALLSGFSKAVDELETFPENHPINRDASKGLGFAVRRIPVGNYGLFYYVDRPTARVQAFSFLHSRQDVGTHIRSDYQSIS